MCKFKSSIRTQKDNIHDAMKKNKFQKGTKKGIAKLTRKEVAEIKFGDKQYNTKQEEADYYGVSRRTIYTIRKRLIWKDDNQGYQKLFETQAALDEHIM